MVRIEVGARGVAAVFQARSNYIASSVLVCRPKEIHGSLGALAVDRRLLSSGGLPQQRGKGTAHHAKSQANFGRDETFYPGAKTNNHATHSMRSEGTWHLEAGGRRDVGDEQELMGEYNSTRCARCAYTAGEAARKSPTLPPPQGCSSISAMPRSMRQCPAFWPFPGDGTSGGCRFANTNPQPAATANMRHAHLIDTSYEVPGEKRESNGALERPLEFQGGAIACVAETGKKLHQAKTQEVTWLLLRGSCPGCSAKDPGLVSQCPLMTTGSAMAAARQRPAAASSRIPPL